MTASTDHASSEPVANATRDSASEHSPLTGPALIIVSILLGLANTVAVLDITIANVSLPHIAGSFGVTTHEATWVITGYAIAEAITVPLTGWLVRRFGTVKVFVVAVSGFGLFSLLCGLSPNFDTLVPMRVLQGLSGGPMIPLTQTLLLQVYSKDKAGAAMGVWALGSVIGPVLGPILGGYICDNASWPWIFFINVPFTVLAGVLCWRFLRHRETTTERAPIDFVGLGLLVLWVGSLQIVLEKGREFDWLASPFIVALTIVAFIAFGVFLIWELTDEHPIVDLRVFATPGFGLSVAILCTVFGGFFANEVPHNLHGLCSRDHYHDLERRSDREPCCPHQPSARRERPRFTRFAKSSAAIRA
jgi:MFS transporter, DHA2 family, multidrug resistance protein